MRYALALVGTAFRMSSMSVSFAAAHLNAAMAGLRMNLTDRPS
jgi:hypothetical protein